MSYPGAIGPNTIIKEEKKIATFLFLSTLLFIIILHSFGIDELTNFWKDQKIWIIGTLSVIISVLYIRFFNIKKNCNKLNIPLGDAKFNPFYGKCENFLNYLWIFGSILLIIERLI